MKKKTVIPQTFKFWKDNRKDQEYQLTQWELKAKYLEYLNKKDPDWILYYGHQTVWAFVSSDDGLRSVSESEWRTVLEDLLVDVRHSLPCYK